MKREIKFRGKRLDNGEWVYGDFIHFSDQTCAIVAMPFSKYGYTATELSRMDQVDPATVGQFTGLKDRNGREIYEGDIIRIPEEAYFPGGNGYVCLTIDGACVQYAHDEFSIWRLPWVVQKGDGVILGNIHDTPELLNKQSHE